MRGILTKLVTACAVTAFALGAGLLVTNGDGERADVRTRPVPHLESTPLADFDSTGVTVLRTTFCDALPEARVAEALGADPDDAASYVNGERAAITPRVTDVAHEFDCTWSAGSGKSTVIAQAWVFAPPVTPDQARALVRSQLADAGCRPMADAPAFGSPSTAAMCHTNRGPQVSYRGLFGDAWLACSLTGVRSREALVDRAGRWCVAAAEAASGG